jgi:prepilin-type N-terminal cleavage/methylation domain-containing protein
MINKAFSLIELIVTIVIIGIVSLSFPLILSQTSNNVAFAMQQEAILAAKTYMGTILSYPWDNNSVITEDGYSRGVVLNVSNSTGNNLLAASFVEGSSAFRAGHISGDLRRKMKLDASGNIIAPCNNLSLCVDKFSIDSFNNVAQILDVIDGTKNIDSILRLTLTPTIRYVNDAPNSGYSYDSNNISFTFNGTAVDGPTNIKRISVEAVNTTAGDPKIKIVLRAYSSNIGEFQPAKKKDYP